MNWQFLSFNLGPRQEIRWRLEKYKELYRHKGLSLTTSGGCQGTTFGDERKNMFRDFRAIFGPWGLELLICWKEQE